MDLTIFGTVARTVVIAGFIASVVSLLAYARAIAQPRVLGLARTGFHISSTSVFIASAALLVLILKHQFQFHYVWAYSGTDLSTGLLMSTFYAGQEGSFLLWTLMVSIIGIVLLSYTQRQHNEAEVMGIYTMILSFLLLLLVVKNPFALIDAPQIPMEGKGLNPLLQNFWMQIHPPILFLGFAAMAPPFALALAALRKGQYQEWITGALPWVVGGSMVLGLGIALGGFWAYETLGWGGWWGWDPVENSSLIPWLVSIAAVHTMVTQKRTRGLVLTNFVLAILAFVLVLYSTFLTRSGVLGNASVHSFVDPGQFAFTLLVLFMFAFTDIGFALLFSRFTRWGSTIWGKYAGWKRILVLYLLVIGPSVPIFAKIIGDVTPVFQEGIATGSFLTVMVSWPLLGIAHVLNILAFLWPLALLAKVALIVYTMTGRLHSTKNFESFGLLSRETVLGIGSAVIGALTLVVLLGTSLPIIPSPITEAINGFLGWWNGMTGSEVTLGKTVEPAFYDTMGLPLAFVIAGLTAFALLLKWKTNTRKDVLSRAWLPLGVALALTVISVLLGVHNGGMILLAFFSFLSLVVNVQVGATILKGNPRFTGAYVAHFGIALMFLGIIGSGFYNQTRSIELVQGKPVDAFGYRLTYTGYEPFHNGERYYFNVKVETPEGGEVETVKTIMFVSMYGGQEQLMRNPGIARFLHKDLYLEPQALIQPDPEGGTRKQFTKGQVIEYGGYRIAFESFDMNNKMGQESFTIGARFRVGRYGEQPVELVATQITGPEGVQGTPARTSAGDLEISVLGITPNREDLSKSILDVRLKNPMVTVQPADMKESLVVEASLKPLISLVWAGIIIMVIGFALAMVRRARESRPRLSQVSAGPASSIENTVTTVENTVPTTEHTVPTAEEPVSSSDTVESGPRDSEAH